MINDESKAAHCRNYLINCFVHPLIAKLFSNWKQVDNYLNGESLETSLSNDPDSLNAFNLLKAQEGFSGLIGLFNNE